MSAADAAATKTGILTESTLLLGFADPAIAQRLANEMERLTADGRPAIASSLLQLRLLMARATPRVILVDHERLQGASLARAAPPACRQEHRRDSAGPARETGRSCQIGRRR